jgi:hypothetical protein
LRATQPDIAKPTGRRARLPLEHGARRSDGAEGEGVGRKSQRAGNGRPWESSERVTLPVLIGFIVFSGFLCLIGTLMWEGVFRAEPPIVVAALVPVGLLVFWLFPLAI